MRIAKGISVTNLSKPISTEAAFDADAVAFFTAASITDTTQKSAVNQLVLDLKSANIWTKMKAIYPLVGGTASTHKYNLKDPRDLDIAFRLFFSGGVTHSSNGILGNATNAYANTFLNPSINFPSGTSSLGIYNKIQLANTGTFLGITIGTTNVYRISPTTTTNIRHFNTGGSVAQTNHTVSNLYGFSANTRTSNTLMLSIDNNSNLQTYTGTVALGYPNYNVLLLANNNSGTIGGFSTAQFSFAYLSDALNSSELINLKSINFNFQTTLGRQ